MKRSNFKYCLKTAIENILHLPHYLSDGEIEDILVVIEANKLLPPAYTKPLEYHDNGKQLEAVTVNEWERE